MTNTSAAGSQTSQARRRRRRRLRQATLGGAARGQELLRGRPHGREAQAPLGGDSTQRVAQLFLALGAERALDDLAAVLADARKDLVRRAGANQHDQCRAVALQLRPELLHEVVVDTYVGG